MRVSTSCCGTSLGSETTDRIVKVDQYAKASIGFYWRIEPAATGAPLVPGS